MRSGHRSEAGTAPCGARRRGRVAELAALVDLGVGLGDGEVVFLVGRHVGAPRGWHEGLDLHLGNARFFAPLRHVVRRSPSRLRRHDLARGGVDDGGEDVVVDHLLESTAILLITLR
jgi:hypothetical protein